MIDAHINTQRGQYDVIATGTVKLMVTEVGYLIGDLFCQLMSQNKESAATYRKLIQVVVTDDSPIWLPEDDDALTAGDSSGC